MKVAICHKDPEVVDTLRRIVTSVRRTLVHWIAYDADEAVRMCKQEPPDLLLLGLLFPKLDGIAATRKIMAESPCAIVIVSSEAKNVSKVYAAMDAGALDVVTPPTATPEGKIENAEKVLEKLTTVRKLVGVPFASEIPQRSVRMTAADKLPTLIAIGASTGGPQALANVISAFPADMDAAVVIVQHFDRLYAQGFVDWLVPRCKMPVQLVAEGSGPKRGVVLVGATNDHLVMEESRALSYTPHPRSKPYRPSVDVFFETIAKYWPKTSIAAVLTGMGRDGALGLLRLRKAGWFTLAQDEQSSVVFGMPKAAAEVGGAMRVLPITEIGPAIVSRVRKRKL